MDVASPVESELLAARARRGDRSAFEALYRRHGARVHALCWRLAGGDQALAEDWTQEAFVQAWRKLDQFRGESRFGTWLHRVAVNVALGERRRRFKVVETDLESAPEPCTAADPGDPLDLEAAIAGLPERARQVFVLHAVEGYSHAAIGEMTGMAEGSSKAHMHRAKALLRETLRT